MAKGILTNREVKNKVTGVDIYVSDYQEVPHKLRNEYLYHVIVVSNLFYYKTREHRESDVVQFMVSKTFAEFEDLYKRLFKRFPSVNFPPLPGKSLFSQNPAGHLDCMDKVLKLVASTLKLSSSPMVISFLRGDALPKELPDSDPEDEPLQPTPPPPPEPVKDVKDEVPNKEFQDVDLFEEKHEEVVEEIISAENVEQVSSGKSIFDDDDDMGNDEDLFGTANKNVVVSSDKPYDLDAELNSLELSDEADELMNLSKTSEKQLSIKVNKPIVKKTNPTKRLFILDDDPNEKEDMFKKASKSKSLWGDDNHHRIDDIFGVKKTSIFDMDDDDDDIFLRSIKKNEIKVEAMKQQDIDAYIKGESVDVTVTEKTDDLVVIELQTEQTNVEMVVDDHPDPTVSNETVSVPAVDDLAIEEAYSAELPVNAPADEQDELFSDEIPPSSNTLTVTVDSVDDSYQGETCDSSPDATVSLTEKAEAFFAEQSVLSADQAFSPDGEVDSSAVTVSNESTPPLDTTVETDIPSLDLTESSPVEPETISLTLELTNESHLESQSEVISLAQTEQHTEQLIEDDISVPSEDKVSFITGSIDTSHGENVDQMQITLQTEDTSLERTEEGVIVEDAEVAVSDVIMGCDVKTSTTMEETKADIILETKGGVMAETVGDAILETEGDLMLETEGDLMLETEGDSMLETEGDSMLETEGDSMLETEGDLMLETGDTLMLETECDVTLETSDDDVAEGSVVLDAEGTAILETEGDATGGVYGTITGEMDSNVMEETENVMGETESTDVEEMQLSVGQISLSVSDEYNNSDIIPPEHEDCLTSEDLADPSASTRVNISLEAEDNNLAGSADCSVSDLDNSEISVENTSIVEETHNFETEFSTNDGQILQIPEVVIDESENSVFKAINLSAHAQGESLDTSSSAPNHISDLSLDNNDNVSFDFSSPVVGEDKNNEQQLTAGVDDDPSPTNLVYSVNLDL